MLETSNIRGVFSRRDKAAKGRGRPSKYDLGRRAARLYQRDSVGHAKVAKELLPDNYAKNSANASKRVKDAIAIYRQHRRKTDPMTDLEDLAHRMLGIQDEPE